jgi:hypothetical protein
MHEGHCFRWYKLWIEYKEIEIFGQTIIVAVFCTTSRHCCYDESNQLITEGPDAPHIDEVGPASAEDDEDGTCVPGLGVIGHVLIDVLPGLIRPPAQKYSSPFKSPQ